MRTGILRKRRWIGVAIVLAAIAALVLMGVLAAEPLLRMAVERSARAQGVELQARDVRFAWGRLQLREMRFTLLGVRGLRGTAQQATISLDGFEPTRVELDGLSVAMVGSAASFSLDLGKWAKEHPEALRYPVAASDAGLQWRERDGADPWLVVDGARVEPLPGGAQVHAPDAFVVGVPVAPVGASWRSDLATVTFGFGNPDPAAALVRMAVAHASAAGTASMTLRPVRLADLAQPLGVELPVPPDVILEAHAELSLRPDETTGAVTGTLSAKLRGYVPPHPKALNGIVFGDVTTFETGLRIAADRSAVVLSATKVAAGAFQLSGDGVLRREGSRGRIELKMGGNIPCSALAKSATEANISGPLGALLGDVASRALKGSVRVDVQVRGDIQQLAAAQVDQQVTPGCGLRLP